MTLPVAPEHWWIWALVLATGFPVLVVALGEVSYHISEANPQGTHILGVFRLFVVPATIALFLVEYVIGYGAEDIIWRLVATVFWIVIIHAVLLILDLLVFGDITAGSWRANVPTLLRDIGRIFLVLLGVAFVLAIIWDVDLAGMLTALGLGSLVIGLALQDTLRNIFSGIALLAENPVRIGDWIQIDEIKGRVMQTNWRAVHLKTLQRELMVIPNSELTTRSIKNFSYEPLHVEEVELLFSATDRPNRIIQVVYEVCDGIEGLSVDEVIGMSVIAHEGLGVRYGVPLICEGFMEALEARDKFMNRIWYAAQRNGLLIGGDGEFGTRTRIDRSDEIPGLLAEILGFTGTSREIIDKLSAASELLFYGEGEYILRQGERNEHLYVILRGSAAVVVESDSGRYEEVAWLSRGQFFGEIALLKIRTTSAHVRAREDLEVIAIDAEALNMLLDQVPELALAVNWTIDARLDAIGTQKYTEILSH